MFILFIEFDPIEDGTLSGINNFSFETIAAAAFAASMSETYK
jgi:hypothetical protein